MDHTPHNNFIISPTRSEKINNCEWNCLMMYNFGPFPQFFIYLNLPPQIAEDELSATLPVPKVFS
jgi:hypothetical protein